MNIHRGLKSKRLLLPPDSGHIPRMKTCACCEYECSVDAKDCSNCGAGFPAVSIPEPSYKKAEKNVIADFPELDMGFEVVEGFSRPDWKMIREFVEAHVPQDALASTWNEIAAKWLEEMVTDLGGNARVIQSYNFYCLSDLEAETTRTLLAYAEFAVGTIRRYLHTAAWRGYNGKHVLLLFSDPDDYYAYVSYYHRAGVHILSDGMFIRRNYAHIALPYVDTRSAQHVLAHELTHNLLCHLPIPVWLNEGLAVTLEKLVTQHGLILDRELAERHRNHWNETNIQAFWAGKTFNIPGDDSQLSYSLGEILVNLLSEKGSDFIEFVKAADWRDGGQDAAVNFFNQGLEESLGGFLGPGNWRPQRKTIAEILKADSNKKNVEAQIF